MRNDKVMATAIVGGGAAGFFLAVCLKEQMPAMRVTILEQGQRVLRKVEVSGGGRCNLTNTFAEVGDLSAVYPRGHRLLKRLFRSFGPEQTRAWWERHGVALTVQADQCIFPASQDAHTVIDCLTGHARRLGVEVRTGVQVTSLRELDSYDYVCITTGGQPRAEGLRWLEEAGVEMVPPVPSLFTLAIADERLHLLMGTVAEHATATIAGTKLRAEGPLLITHWGMSGPCILRLSSHAARHLAACDYHAPLSINWTGHNEADTLAELQRVVRHNPQKLAANVAPFALQQRLWAYIYNKVATEKRWCDLNKKELNRLVNALTNDTYQTSGRAPFKDEFVTCGGIALSSIDPNTLASRHRPTLFFAGEVLDIDGITGGFNFQAAWTTAHTVADAIARAAS